MGHGGCIIYPVYSRAFASGILTMEKSHKSAYRLIVGGHWREDLSRTGHSTITRATLDGSVLRYQGCRVRLYKDFFGKFSNGKKRISQF